MLGEAVESCQACRPWATRPTLPSAKSARSQRDGAALGVVRRCADEESTPWLSVGGAPCSTPNGATTYITVFTNSSTKLRRILVGDVNRLAAIHLLWRMGKLAGSFRQTLSSRIVAPPLLAKHSNPTLSSREG